MPCGEAGDETALFVRVCDAGVDEVRWLVTQPCVPLAIVEGALVRHYSPGGDGDLFVHDLGWRQGREAVEDASVGDALRQQWSLMFVPMSKFELDSFMDDSIVVETVTFCDDEDSHEDPFGEVVG